MDERRYRQIDRVFAEVLERPVDERAHALASLCGDDEELRREVRALLAAEDMAGDFLAAPLAPGDLPWNAGERRDPCEDDRRAGPYRLLEVIGRGGAAVVHRARRDDTGQEVAVKLSQRRGRHHDTLHFIREWKVLSRLDHPSIARCHGFGTTESGHFYLAMELVDGVPLDRFCDERRLGVDRRLELFRELCGAVGHTHELGVVHRDLKPSNVLVTRTEQIKLLDFGIAKPFLAEGIEPDPQPSTQTGLRLLTPGYASPEQLEGGELLPASDVYSLGVLLFELLTGSFPYEIGDGWPLPIEILEAVSRRPPRTLTDALSHLARDPGRAAEVASARRAMRLDDLRRELSSQRLEAIVARALEKRPELRYPTAGALGDAVGRHLDGRARPSVFDLEPGRLLGGAGRTCRRLFERARGRSSSC